MQIILTDLSGKSHTYIHDLNFQSSKYDIKHQLILKNPKAGSPLYEALRDSGPVPNDANGDASGKKRASEVGGGAAQKKKKGDGKGGVDMDKLAEGLQKLQEDDLLQVVQMVHDNKTEESWMRNDVEQGEFHVDLYTLPDNLLEMLWKFSKEKGVVETGGS
jgi:transcription initiation factor IIF auxiliary subunit